MKNRQFSNLLSVLILFYVIYHLLINGVNTVWNWIVVFLAGIGNWVGEHTYIVIISFVVLTLVPFIFNTLFMVKQTQKSPDENNASPLLTLEEKQNESFERWYEINQDKTLDRTEKMIDIMNEMLKSNRHKKEYVNKYKKLLSINGFGYVYFVKAPDGTTKIGRTRQDPYKRIIQIFGGVNTSYSIKVIHLIRTDQPEKIEGEFHEYFLKKRHVNPYDPTEKSEFFHLNGDDWKEIKREGNEVRLFKRV